MREPRAALPVLQGHGGPGERGSGEPTPSDAAELTTPSEGFSRAVHRHEIRQRVEKLSPRPMTLPKLTTAATGDGLRAGGRSFGDASLPKRVDDAL